MDQWEGSINLDFFEHPTFCDFQAFPLKHVRHVSPESSRASELVTSDHHLGEDHRASDQVTDVACVNLVASPATVNPSITLYLYHTFHTTTATPNPSPNKKTHLFSHVKT